MGEPRDADATACVQGDKAGCVAAGGDLTSLGFATVGSDLAALGVGSGSLGVSLYGIFGEGEREDCS